MVTVLTNKTKYFKEKNCLQLQLLHQDSQAADLTACLYVLEKHLEVPALDPTNTGKTRLPKERGCYAVKRARIQGLSRILGKVKELSHFRLAAVL